MAKLGQLSFIKKKKKKEKSQTGGELNQVEKIHVIILK